MPRKKVEKSKTVKAYLIIGTERMDFQYTYPSTRADGRLYVYIDSGRKNIYGNIKYDIVYGKDEYSLKNNILKYYDKKQNVGTSKYQTIETAINNWMNNIKTLKLKGNSFDTMEDTIRLYILPVIGKIRVCDITSNDCQELITNLSKKGYSLSTVNKVYIHLNDFFNYLIKTDTLQVSPLKAVEKPTKEKITEIRSAKGKEKTHNKYFTKEQVKAIQSVIYNGYSTTGISRSGKEYTQDGMKFIYQAPIFDFLLQTGLRISEMCALRFSDWDEEKHTITIQKNRVEVYKRDNQTNERIGTGKIVIETDTKTQKSNATIGLSDYANDILINLKKDEPNNYKGYILHTKDGRPMVKDGGVRGRWHRLLAAAGIEKRIQVDKTSIDKYGKEKTNKKTVICEEYGIHTTRHTYASFLYQETHDIIFVSKKLRHSDPAFTASVYVDIMEEYEKDIDKSFKV